MPPGGRDRVATIALSDSSVPRRRGAVIGLGMIGRHHARLLQSSDRVAFAGAVDPGGDRYRAVHDPALVFGSVDELLAAGGLDFAIVAVPTELHLPMAEQLGAAGVAMLIEKPLASSSAAAREIVALCARAGVLGAVGHVERFNPALQELRRRLLDGQIGRLFTASTIRSGPFPARIQDVGVVKDLATHDIDLVSWLADSQIATVAAQIQHLAGREHEDLVLAIGSLRSGAAFNTVVDWVSPTKTRRTRVLGERGLLEADTLTGDLMFYENGEIGVVWSAAQQFRGVSEGNVTKYALRREEPLRIEHRDVPRPARREAGGRHRDAREGRGDRRGRRGGAGERALRPDRHPAHGGGELMRVVVVALGKIGLPLAAKIALAGHEVVGCDVDQRVVELVKRAQEPFPGEAGLAEALAEVIGSGRLRAVSDTAAAVGDGADLVIAVPPVVVDEAARPDFSILDAVVRDIARGLQPGTVVSIETTIPVGTTRQRVAPELAEISGLVPERDFFVVHSPERVYSGRIFADLENYPKLVGGCSPEGERRAAELYRGFLSAEVRELGSAEAAELTKLAETTYRDVNIALANEFARFADRHGIDVELVIEAANSQPFSHIHRPGVAVGGHCIPVYPRFYLSGDAEARLPAVAREVNEAMPGYAVTLLAEELGEDLRGAAIVILGVSYRGKVKETAFSGAFPLATELRRRGATVLAADPLYTDEELSDLGFTPWTGEAVAGAVVQADHPEYRSLVPTDLAGIRVIVDGRGVLDPGPWSEAGVALRRIGRG